MVWHEQALINTFGKFSHAMHVVQTMRVQSTRRQWTKFATVTIIVLMVFVAFPALLLTLKRRRTAKVAVA